MYFCSEVHGRNPLIAKGRGYTIAADMWSLGALTTALYLGRSFFVADPESSDSAVLVNAAKCDLGELDHSPFWQNVDYRSRDFIKKLLTLDEKSRLDVGQALEHEWFTACGRRLVLEEKYCQLIKGWIPRRVLIDFKEDLDASLDARRVMTDVRSMLQILDHADHCTVPVDASSAQAVSSLSAIETGSTEWADKSLLLKRK